MSVSVELIDICIPDGLPLVEAMRHGAATVRVKGGSRVYTHEQVRHRKASYSQQSQRYVDEKGFEFIVPEEITFDEDAMNLFNDMMTADEEAYKQLQSYGLKNQIARYLLPNACESEIVITMTWKWWVNFCRLRCSPAAQPEMQHIAETICFALCCSYREFYSQLLPETQEWLTKRSFFFSDVVRERELKELEELGYVIGPEGTAV